MNTQQSICALICQSDGIKARDIAKKLDLDHKTVNRALYTSPLMGDIHPSGRRTVR
jgi:predicted transcriptional regulator